MIGPLLTRKRYRGLSLTAETVQKVKLLLFDEIHI